METPDYLHGYMQEAVLSDRNAAFLRQDAAERAAKWAVILGLAPTLDGDQFFVLWGDDIQSGVCGFGATPEAAIAAFEKAMSAAAPVKPHPYSGSF